MSSKIDFDYQSKINNYLSSKPDGFLKNLKVCSLKSELFNLAVSYAGRKIDVVFKESDYVRLGKVVISALKSACADYTVMIVEGSKSHKNAKIDYDGSVVIAVGGYELLSLASYYASQEKIPFYAVISEPCLDFLLSGKVRCNITGIVNEYKITPPRSVIFDFDVVSLASPSTLSEGYLKIASQLLSLVDYKFRVLITGETFNQNSYVQIRNALSLIASISKFSNPKDVLVYASFVMAIENEFCTILRNNAVDLFEDALSIYAPKLSKGEIIKVALTRLVELYCAYFANDFSKVLRAPNYNKDIETFERQTGVDCTFLYDNLKVPSTKRLSLISEVVKKTKDGFISDLKSTLDLIPQIIVNYNSLLKTSKGEESLSFEQKLNALRLAPYLSKTQSVLTVIRDLGLIELIK